MSLASSISINIFQTFNFSLQQYFAISTSLFQLVYVAHIQNSVEYIITNIVCCKFSSLSLTINSSFRLLNICLSQLANPSYIKNMYRASILVELILFSCILVRQGLNYSNALSVKNSPVQATCFMAVSSPGPLLIILILIYIRNPLNLQASPKKYSTNSILIVQ